jgi:transposase-like protein
MAAEPLTQAAAARHQRAVERAERALRDLDGEGAQISFQSVARRAGVSRQWLYTQPELRTEIERLRDRGRARPEGVPSQQRATEASLRQRIETLRAENQRLREENTILKTELAIAYGRQRSPLAGGSTVAPLNGRPSHDT